jgi:hypothetical protein
MMSAETMDGSAASALRAVESKAQPNFMFARAQQLRMIIQRTSPMFREGAWPSAEACLLAAVVEQWLGDVVQEARRQVADDGRLWVSAQVRTLFGTERRSIEAVASAIGIEPVCIDRIVGALGLSFLPTEEAIPQ